MINISLSQCNTIYLLCTDDSILARSNKDKINSIINKIEAAKLDITILDNLKDFLVVYITKEDDSHMHMFQLDLINQINKQAF